MKKISLFAFMLAGFLSQAQNNLTIEEATLAAQKGFGTKSFYSAQWRTNNELTYIDAPYNALIAKDTNGTADENLVTAADLEAAITTAINEKDSLRMIPVDYQWENAEELSFTYQGESDKYFVVDNIGANNVSELFKLDAHSSEDILAAAKNYVGYW